MFSDPEWDGSPIEDIDDTNSALKRNKDPEDSETL